MLIATWILYNYFTTVFEEHVQGKPPLVANSWLEFLTGRSANVQELIKRGYEQYSKKGLPFRYYEGFDTPLYVMPPSHFASVRRSLDSVISSSPANEANLVLHPFLGEDSEDIIPLVRTSITKSINALIPTLTNEIAESMKTYFPSKPDAKHPLVTENGITWTPTNIHTATLPTIGRVISRVLLGKKYSSDPEFTILISDFAQGIVFQAFLLRLLPRWLCFKIAPLFNTTRRLKKIQGYILDDVVALIRSQKSRSTPSSSSNSDSDIPEPKEGDELLILPMLVEYVLKQDRYAKYSEDQLVWSIMGRFLGIAFATIDTTTLTLTHVMHDLLAHPYADYSTPIMEQAAEVKAQNGGMWSVKSLGELSKLDSFVKEVQRLRPIGYILGKRRVMKEEGAVFVSGAGPLEVPGYSGSLSGPEIFVPKDIHLIMPTWGLHTDEKVYQDAETFSGFRFADDRVASSQPTDRFLSFGHGRHACPGRHLALVIIKLFVLEFLEGFEYKEGQERLKAWSFQTACVPDMEGRVLIRKRKEHEQLQNVHINGNGTSEKENDAPIV